MVLEALGYALFVRDAQGSLRAIGAAAGVVAAAVAGARCADGELPVSDASPFFENFLIDAEECWRAGGDQRAQSGPWIEQDGRRQQIGNSKRLAMTANGQSLLLIKRLGAEFEAKKDVLQKARETVIAHQRLNSEIQKKEILLHYVADEMTRGAREHRDVAAVDRDGNEPAAREGAARPRDARDGRAATLDPPRARCFRR